MNERIAALVALLVAVLELVDSLHFAAEGELLWQTLFAQFAIPFTVTRLFYLFLGVVGLLVVVYERSQS